MKGVVYTSLDHFCVDGWKVETYKCLNDELVEWIEQTTINLIETRNKAELKAGIELGRFLKIVEKQVFFMIHGRCYFLDYYCPEKRIAIEIDGGYHKGRKDIDAQRDKDFMEIGVKTIRIKDTDVLNGRLMDMLTKKSRRNEVSKKKKTASNKERKGSKLIAQAMKRLRQHDRMMHNARWI